MCRCRLRRWRCYPRCGTAPAPNTCSPAVTAPDTVPTSRSLGQRSARPPSIEKLRLHDLRHSYASLAAAGGASLPIIGKLLGHTQVATTGRYAHLDVDPLREVAERVGAIVAGAGKAGAEVTELPRTRRHGSGEVGGRR